MRTGPGVPAWMAGQCLAVAFPASVDGAEGGCGQGGEDARVVGDGGGDALAAGQSGADELVGVGPVDLGAGRAAGGAAGLAGDGQDAAGFVHGGVAVDQFAGGSVDVIDAATQQHGLQASTGVPDGACRGGVGGQRWYSSRLPLRAVDERRQTAARSRECRDAWISGAVPHGSLARVACRSGLHVWLVHRDPGTR